MQTTEEKMQKFAGLLYNINIYNYPKQKILYKVTSYGKDRFIVTGFINGLQVISIDSTGYIWEYVMDDYGALRAKQIGIMNWSDYVF